MTSNASSGMRAVHTPQGRFVRTEFPAGAALHCGHQPNDGGLAFRRFNGQGDLPDSLCFACMDRFLRDFAAGKR